MTPRIDPAWAIRPGRRDPLGLLTAWFVRKSFYWVLGAGLIIAALTGRTDEIGNSFDSPGAVWEHLLSPLVVVLLALFIRFASAMLGLALAYPLARAHDVDLSPRTNFGSGIGRWLDRLHVARAYRSLRWTHHVRQVAIARLGDTGARLGRIDPIMDIVNITMIVLAVVVAVAAAP